MKFEVSSLNEAQVLWEAIETRLCTVRRSYSDPETRHLLTMRSRLEQCIAEERVRLDREMYAYKEASQ